MKPEFKIQAILNGVTYSTLSHIYLNEARPLRKPVSEITPLQREEYSEKYLELGSGLMVPIHVWLITGPGGPILVDTGVPPCEELRQIIESHGGEFKPCRQEEEWLLDRQLARFGFKLEDIHTIILTHLHGDHYGNNELFPNACFYVHEAEIPMCIAPPKWAPFYRPGYMPHFLRVLDRVIPISGDRQLIEGIDLMHIGGHAPGLMSVLVSTRLGRVAIAGDLIHSYGNLELDWPLGSLWNLNQAMHSMQRLRESAEIILPSHDWELWERFPDGIIG